MINDLKYIFSENLHILRFSASILIKDKLDMKQIWKFGTKTTRRSNHVLTKYR